MAFSFSHAATLLLMHSCIASMDCKDNKISSFIPQFVIAHKKNIKTKAQKSIIKLKFLALTSKKQQELSIEIRDIPSIRCNWWLNNNKYWNVWRSFDNNITEFMLTMTMNWNLNTNRDAASYSLGIPQVLMLDSIIIIITIDDRWRSNKRQTDL